MYQLSFIFRPGTYDAEFERLDAQIATIAQQTPGYLGVQTWQSADGTLHNAVYSWDHLDNLKDFSRSAAHLQAKREYARWYDGYEVIVAEVLSRYGDGRLG
jgi:heme-degrading monooxygenase HmoA